MRLNDAGGNEGLKLTFFLSLFLSSLVFHLFFHCIGWGWLFYLLMHGVEWISTYIKECSCLSFFHYDLFRME